MTYFSRANFRMVTIEPAVKRTESVKMASDHLFWIECNACPAQGQLLSLTECGHIYCPNCVEKLKSNNNKCPVCKRTTTYQTLDDTLPDAIKTCFKPWTISSLMETVSNFQKIEKFHKIQIQLYARNSIKKQHLLKKQLQSAHAKIQTLLKDLSTKDECIKAYRARDNNNEKTTPTEQFHSIAPYKLKAISLKMSTPNSKAFINGILKNNSQNLHTPTPFERNSTPINARPRSTSVQAPTPTPISSNNSTEKQRMTNPPNQRQTLSQNKFTPINQTRQSVSHSINRMTQSKLNAPTPGGSGLNPMAPPSKMGRPRHLPEASPALMSYRKLIQDRANIGIGSIYKNILNSGMSSSSLRIKSYVKSNLGDFSSVSRKRPNSI